MAKTDKKTLSVGVGDNVRSLVHNLDGVVLSTSETKSAVVETIYNVELENGEVRHFNANQLKKK